MVNDVGITECVACTGFIQATVHFHIQHEKIITFLKMQRAITVLTFKM